MRVFVNTHDHPEIGWFAEYIEGDRDEVYKAVMDMRIDPDEPVAIFIDDQYINCDELDLYQKIGIFDSYWFNKTMRSINDMTWLARSYRTPSGSLVTYKKNIELALNNRFSEIDKLVTVSPVRLQLGYDTTQLSRIFKESKDHVEMVMAIEKYLSSVKYGATRYNGETDYEFLI